MDEPQASTSRVQDPYLTSAAAPVASTSSAAMPPPAVPLTPEGPTAMDVDPQPGPSTSKSPAAEKPIISKDMDEPVVDAIEVLSDFLHQLEDYTPTIPDAVTSYFCQTAGFEPSDPRIVRLISIAAQKFVSDVANDALQHCKTRTNNAPTSHSSSKNPKAQANNKDRKFTLSMEDLAPALSDYGITVRKAHYFV